MLGTSKQYNNNIIPEWWWIDGDLPMVQSEKETLFSKSKNQGWSLSKNHEDFRVFRMAWNRHRSRFVPPSNYPMLKSRGSEPPYWSLVHNVNWQTWLTTTMATKITTMFWGEIWGYDSKRVPLGSCSPPFK